MPARPSPAVVVVALALLLGIQPVTTDLYLPALPQLTAHFAAPMSAAQLTLAGLIASFGIGQLALGPVADRFGRRPVLLAGLSLYVASSLASAAAPSIEWLIVARVAQGIGMAAAVVCARAMVRDLFEPYQGMHVMSQALSGLGLLALVSPVVGGLLAAGLGWRAALLGPAVAGAATLALIALRVPESARHLNPRATQIGPLARTFIGIARDPTFCAWALLVTCTYAGLFAFLAGSSFIYINAFGVSRPVYGLLLASSSIAYLAGTFVCRSWLASSGARATVRRAGSVTCAGGVLYAALALADAHTLPTLVVAQALYSFGHGVHQPCGQAGVVGPFPMQAGAASALSGFVLSVGAFAMGLWLGTAMDGSVRPYALTIAVLALATSAVAWTLVQRHGEPVRAASPAAAR